MEAEELPVESAPAEVATTAADVTSEQDEDKDTPDEHVASHTSLPDDVSTKQSSDVKISEPESPVFEKVEVKDSKTSKNVEESKVSSNDYQNVKLLSDADAKTQKLATQQQPEQPPPQPTTTTTESKVEAVSDKKVSQSKPEVQPEAEADVSVSVRDRAKHLNKITSETDLQNVTTKKSAEKISHQKVAPINSFMDFKAEIFQ